MTKRYRDYNVFLLEKLKDPELALAYLNEAFHDEDQRVFLLALKHVLEAQGEATVDDWLGDHIADFDKNIQNS